MTNDEELWAQFDALVRGLDSLRSEIARRNLWIADLEKRAEEREARLREIEAAALPVVRWSELAEGENHFLGKQIVQRRGAQIIVFSGNSARDFVVPSGYRFVGGHIGLVDTRPEFSRMALPEGRVDVRLPSGELLAVGDVVPAGVSVVSVETPLASGCSNWAGPCIEFDTVLGTDPIVPYAKVVEGQILKKMQDMIMPRAREFAKSVRSDFIARHGARDESEDESEGP